MDSSLQIIKNLFTLFFQNPRGMVTDGLSSTESEYEPVKIFSTKDFFKEDDIIKKNKS